MDKKFLALVLLAGVLAAGFSLATVFAKSEKGGFSDSTYILPEQDGTYDVPGRSDLKLRVIVHNEKPARAKSSALVCNLSDPDSPATVAPAQWRLPAGTWVYTLNKSSVPLSVGASNLAIMASDAFGKWSDATGASDKVLFSQNSAYTTINRARIDGKNIIAWGRTSGTALAVTYTWYYTSTGLAVETDTIMNNRVKWSWSNPATWTGPGTTCANDSSYDAQNILTHELGHWMGLADMYNASTYQNATMYGYGSKAEIKKNTLTTGDVAGILSIY